MTVNRVTNREAHARVPRVLVLIFDSDDATRYLYQRELSRSYTVFLAGTEQEALDTLCAEEVDVLVLEPAALDDAEWSFLNRLRVAPDCNPIAVVICSTLDERRRAAEFDVDAYLIKPVLAATLLETVSAVLPHVLT